MDASTGNVVGSVDSIEGRVIAVAADGTVRILAEGDLVYEGEQITTQSGAQIQILLSNGSLVPLDGQSTQLFDNAFIASISMDEQGDADQDADDESDADQDDAPEPEDPVIAPEVVDFPVDELSSPEAGDESSVQTANAAVNLVPVIERNDDNDDEAAEASADYRSQDREDRAPLGPESSSEVFLVPSNLKIPRQQSEAPILVTLLKTAVPL